jgi:predicted enzyme related to lactoylglutathione lyase
LNALDPKILVVLERRTYFMSANLSHFAINADDVPRARQFYESVFGWRFTPWGPPDFYQITTGSEESPGIRGALQGRRELAPGVRILGYECSLSVTDVDATAAAVVNAGGRVLMDKTTITGVGHLIFFEDTEGNIAGAMQYDDKAE